MKKLHRVLLFASSLGLVGGMLPLTTPKAEAQVNIQFRVGTRDRPLAGGQYQTMRQLARTLDEEAWQASNIASEQVAYSPRTQRVVNSINDFATRAADFHDRIERYETKRWDLPTEVVALDKSAAYVNAQIRRGRTYSEVVSQWNDVVTVLNNMKQLLAGNDVVAPPSHNRFPIGFSVGLQPSDQDRGRTYDRNREAGNYAPNGRPLAGRELDEFRGLARELDANVAREVETAERSRGQRNFDENLFASIRQLNNEVSTLWQNVDREPVDPARALPTVQRLSNDARNLLQNVRTSGPLSTVTPQAQRTVEILDRMQQLLR